MMMRYFYFKYLSTKVIFSILHQRRRMGMEKQLHFFTKDNKCCNVWIKLPEHCRRKIESLLAELIIKYLTSSSKEVESHEEK